MVLSPCGSSKEMFCMITERTDGHMGLIRLRSIYWIPSDNTLVPMRSCTQFWVSFSNTSLCKALPIWRRARTQIAKTLSCGIGAWWTSIQRCLLSRNVICMCVIVLCNYEIHSALTVRKSYIHFEIIFATYSLCSFSSRFLRLKTICLNPIHT